MNRRIFSPKWLPIWTLSVLLVGMVQPARAQIEELAAADTIWNTYKHIIEILQSNDPKPEDKIVAQLASLKGALQAIDSKMQKLDDEAHQILYVEKRNAYLNRVAQVKEWLALALTAHEAILQWQQTGKTDTAKLGRAAYDAQRAANTLMGPELYMLAGSGPNNPPDIFEYRTTLLPYLYTLTVRLGAVALEQPQFRKFFAYTEEFKNHVAWLKQIPALLEQEISCQNLKRVALGSYAIYSFCTDTLSGYRVAINGMYPGGSNPYLTPWALGSDADANNAFGYYTFYDHWWVQEEMGEHAVTKILPYVVHAATPWSPTEIFANSTSKRESGPLSNSGKCFDAHFGYLADCNRSSPTQQWTAEAGVAAPISALNPSPRLDACLEVFEWRASLNAYIERCSGSSSEQWILSNANEIRWGRDPSLCLQNDLHLHACNGAPNQRWYRTWPSPVSTPAPFPFTLGGAGL